MPGLFERSIGTDEGLDALHGGAAARLAFFSAGCAIEGHFIIQRPACLARFEYSCGDAKELLPITAVPIPQNQLARLDLPVTQS